MRKRSKSFNNQAQLFNENGLLNGLISQLRRKLSDDSPLLPYVNDYSLFTKLGQNNYNPQACKFDLAKIADIALSSVKKLNPVSDDVHIILSLKPETPRLWVGHPEVLESLMRNLLLISLSRTQSGLVCLRVRHETQDGQNKLIFMLEDSAQNMSQGRIKKFIKSFGANSEPSTIDISFPIVSRIITKFGGSFETEEYSKDICFNGWIPIEATSQEEIVESQITSWSVFSKSRPLVMMVEDDETNRMMQSAIFHKLGYKVFALKNGTDALKWSSVLPFSLIALDNILPGMSGPVVAERLRRMAKEQLLNKVTIAALTAGDALHDLEAWHNAGVEHILFKPIRTQYIHNLHKEITHNVGRFYKTRDSLLDQELRKNMKDKMPELEMEIKNQVIGFCNLLSQDTTDDELLHSAHALKSSSLSMGYYRLSGLASNIEYNTAQFNAHYFKDNRALIREYLLKEFG